MAWPKLCTAVLLGAAALFTASCAKSEFDENEAFVGTIHGGDALTSPDAATFKVKSSSDRSMQTVSWAAVKGALDYKVWIYESDSEFPESGNPGDEYLIVKDSLIHNPYVTIDRAKSKYYYMRVLTAENKAENNPGASTETTYPWDTFLIEVSVPGDEASGGGDFYKFLDYDDTGKSKLIDKLIKDNGGKITPIAFYFKPDIDYTMSGAVDFSGYEVTLMSEDDSSLSNIVIDDKGQFIIDNTFTLDHIKLTCTDSKKNLIELNKNSNIEIGKGDFYYIRTSVSILNTTIEELGYRLLYDEGKKFYLESFKIDNCNLHFTIDEGLDSHGYIDMSKGAIKELSITNSTLWNSGDNNIELFVKYDNNNSVHRTDYQDLTQKVIFNNNTFYNIANKAWANWNNAIIGSGAKYSEIEVLNNIWVNCSRDGGGIARRLLNTDNYSSFKNVTINNNTYMCDGKTESNASQFDKGNILTDDPNFLDPGNGDFTPRGESQLKEKTGDPRWIPTE